MSADPPRRLGRGLEALISTARQQREPPEERSHAVAAGTTPAELSRVRVADIHPNPFQPRRTFVDAELSALASSIAANGLLQPITVRPRPSGGGWELVAGERRLRAVSRLRWTDVPALVRDFDDREMLTLALVENLQRAELNPVDEAEGYQRLIEEFGFTQQQVADAVGRDRTTITNLLRILSLPPAVRRMVAEGALSAGHARALLPVREEKQLLQLAREVAALGLSVRQVEARAREIAATGGETRPAATGPALRKPGGDGGTASAPVRRIEDQLRRRLQTDVAVEINAAGKGSLKISFYSHDDLERLRELIAGTPSSDFD